MARERVSQRRANEVVDDERKMPIGFATKSHSLHRAHHSQRTNAKSPTRLDTPTRKIMNFAENQRRSCSESALGARAGKRQQLSVAHAIAKSRRHCLIRWRRAR